jgi:hypothetical protein
LRCVRAAYLAVGHSRRFEPILGNFVRDDEHCLLVGVEAPVEPEAFAPLVLARQRDLERLNILFVQKRVDQLRSARRQVAQRSGSWTAAPMSQ